jgi:hypothetical protein
MPFKSTGFNNNIQILMLDPGSALRNNVNFNLKQRVDKPVAPCVQKALEFAIYEVQAFFIFIRFAVSVQSGDQFRKPCYEIFPVIIGSKNFPAFDSPDDHRLQRARCICSRFPWHDRQLSHTFSNIKHKIIDVLSIT